MLSWLPAPIKGILVATLQALWLICLGAVVYVVGLFKYLIPISIWQKRCSIFLNQIPVYWTGGSTLIVKLFNKIDVELTGDGDLSEKKWYLMTSNHQSWVDIFLLHQTFNHRVPVLKFFVKSQVFYVPFFGGICWLIGYPFMKRYTKDQIAKNPQLKGTDLATTKKMCERFKVSPVTIISFAEGTRYTTAKAARQKTPYKHLLRPRAGGLAYTLMVMGENLHEFIDVTIIYPEGNLRFWDYICGRLKKVVIHVKTQPITQELLGDYENDREYRARFQGWLNKMWQEKDDEIERVTQAHRKSNEKN